MKQYITPKQLYQLSEKGKKKLNKWWIKREYAGGSMFDGYNTYPLPLLNIGEMIEFLNGETDWYLRIGHWMNPGAGDEKYTFNHMGWVVGDYRIDESFDIEIWDGKELCDALWEAVKDILNTT
jgi:hypothetical protein